MADAIEVDISVRYAAGADEVSLTGVILAAGLSRRMGFPKALLEWGAETYLDRMIRMFGAVCADVVVVLRPGGDATLGACRRLGDARVVWNPDADRGQLSSLQAGLAAAGNGHVLFSPIDYAHVSETTVRRVAAEAGALVCQPEYGGRHGHPVRIAPEVAAALLAEAAEGVARDVIRRFPRVFLPVEDAGCVSDADDPAAFAALREQLK